MAHPATRSIPRRIAWITGLHLVLFSAARLLLWLVYRDSFAGTSDGDVAWAFVDGLRFDLSIALTFLGLPFLFLLLPRVGAWAPWRRLWTAVAFVVLVVLTAALIGDLAWFALVGRHVGVELVTVGDDVTMMSGVIFGEYWWTFLLLAASVLAMAWVWRALCRWDGRAGYGPAPWFAIVLFLPLLVLAVRGGLQGKPLAVVNAFASGSVERGLLTLNGPFSMYHSLVRTRAVETDFMAWDAAVEETRALVLGDGEEFVDDAYPLLRRRRQPSGAHPNVAVVILESWDALYVDSVRRRQGLPALGATPHFDALGERGLVFTRCYAGGTNSMAGLASILAGVPNLPGLSYLGRGLEQSRLAYLGDIAGADGYATLLLQGSKRSSFRVDAISSLAGFEHYEGMEDIVAALEVEPMGKWGTWDGDLYERSLALFNAAPEPWLGVVFTASTHKPYLLPEGSERPFGPGVEHADYLNSLYYADACLGAFVAGLDLEDTAVVVIADHVSRLGDRKGDARTWHHIPALLLAPEIEPAVREDVVSQLDVLPTLIEVAGWSGAHAGLGRSWLDATRPQGALAERGEIVFRYEEDGFVGHDGARRLLEHGPDSEPRERRLLAEVQVLHELIEKNRVYPGNE